MKNQNPFIRQLDAHAAVRPDTIAVCTGRRTVSWAQLSDAVAGVAARLHGAGIGPEQRLGILAGADIDHVVALLALQRLRAVACPVSTRWPAPLIRDRLMSVGVARLLVGTGFGAVAREVRGIPVMRLPAAASSVSVRTGGETWNGTATDDATLLFTTSSTGPPKGVLHSAWHHWINAGAATANVSLRPGDRWLLSLPLYHIGGYAIVCRCLFAGATLVLTGGMSADEATLRRLSVTHVSLVATQLARLLRSGSGCPPCLRGVLVGGGPTPTGLVTAAVQRGIPVCLTYGCTEAASQVTCTQPYRHLPAPSSTGMPLIPGTVRLAADGEILLRGGSLFRGYATVDHLAPARDDDGWFHARDRGVWDAAGGLRILGRVDNVFISGGENVQAEEIETILTACAGIEQAVVVPVPDAEFGQRPVAFVAAAAGNDWTAEALAAQVAAHLPRFKVPVAFLPWSGPEAERLKPDRRALCVRAAALRTSHRDRRAGGSG